MVIYKKNVTRYFVLIFLSFLLCSNSFIISFADENLLTYEDAIKLAVKNNRNVSLISEQIENLELRLASPGKSMPVSITGNPSLSAQLMLGDYKLNNLSKTTKMQLEALLDGLELQIKSSFYKISMAEEEILFKKEKLKEQINKYEILNIKYKMGTVSSYDIEKSQLEIEALKEEIKTKELELKKSYDDLRVILGARKIDNNIQRLDIEYIPIDNLKTSPEYQAAKAVSESVTIFAKQKAIEEAKLGADFGYLEYISAGLSQTEWTVTPIPIRRSEIKLKDIELRNAKEELYFSIVETFNTLKSIEAGIDQLNVQLNILDQNIKAMEARLSVGIVTQREIDDVLMLKKELLLSIEKLKSDHTMLRMQYQNPHLMSGI